MIIEIIGGFKMQENEIDKMLAKAGKRYIEGLKAFKILIQQDKNSQEIKELSNKLDHLIFHKGLSANDALKTIGITKNKRG